MAPRDPSNVSIMRALGLVAGDLWAVFAGKRPGKKTTLLRRDVQEREVATPRGTVLLRRTTIDEVEKRPPAAQ
jgi:hypothetical protein